MTTTLPGYTLGSGTLPRSPVTLAEFELMKRSALFGEEDVEFLRLSRGILETQTDAILDVWYGFVASQPHLLASFSSPEDGSPDESYLAAVRERFGQWILDTAAARYDQDWLDYQHEIGHRHYRTKKNVTDGARGSAIVPFRDLFLLIFPVTFTLRPFLASMGHSAEDVEKMYGAWVKSCLLQVTLWSYPYIRSGDF
jgi:hypothetical protein